MKHFFTLLFLLCAAQVFAVPDYVTPTLAPTNFTATSTEGDRINISWTNGNGTRRLVIARKASAVTFVPVDGTSYSASLNFGAGNEVALGEFVVYNGNNSSATIASLQPNTQYHFAVFEFNGTGTDISYLTTITHTSGKTITAPTAQPSNFTATNIIGNSLKLNWTNPTTASGGGTGRIIIGREGSPVNVNPVDLSNYTANLQFGQGSQIGAGNYVLAETNASSITVESLKPGTQYFFAIFEYKGNNGLVYNVIAPPTINVTTLPRPTVNASAPVFSSIEGTTMKLAFTRGNGAKRIVVAKAGGPVSAIPTDGASYTANSVFGTAGTAIASGEFVLANGIMDNVSISNLAKATTYYFAVFEYDGTGSYTAYYTASPLTTSQSTVSAPTLQVSNVNITNVLNNSVTFSWTPGNGARRMVIMRKDYPVTAGPTDLTQYGFSSIFGSGTQIGTGNYVVYNNNGSSTTVTGLAAGATYHFVVYEYNGSGTPVYLISNAPVAQFTTGQSPTTIPGSFEWSNIEGNRLTVSWANGNGNRRMVVVKAGSAVTGSPVNGTSYTANASFGSGDQLGAGEYVVMNGTSNQVNFLNLQPGTTYHVAVFEYNLVNNSPFYLATPGTSSNSTVSVPTTGATALQFSNVTGNSMKLTWTNGNGSKRLVIAKANSPVDVVPSNFRYYNDNSLFGNGGHLGNGNYSISSSNANTVTLIGLIPGTTYHFAVYEYNGIGHPVYLTTAELKGSQITNERPTIATSNFTFPGIDGNRITLRWTAGNGAKRLLVGRAGSPVAGRPVDGVDYTGNTVFGSGDALAPGEFVIMDGNQAEAGITNLIPGTTYHFAMFEYDGIGTGTRYLITSFGSANAATLSAPIAGPDNILYSSIGTTTATINWTTAVADKHLVVIRKASPVSAMPQQLTSYSASTTYGHSGALLSPEHYVLFASSGSLVNATFLQPGTTYYISVFAFNGNIGPMYNTTNIATSSFTTLGPPTDAASNVAVQTAGNGTSVSIRWKNGSGQRRLVLMKAGSTVNGMPTDNTPYLANNFFGSGQEVGSANFAVYNGTADNVTVSNLQKNQVYYIAVYEYNQFSTGPVYLTTSFAQGQFSGVILPVKLANFNGVASPSANLLQWTTAQEINASEFVIERSLNGIVFEAIGKVAARGNSNTTQTYQFEDKNRAAVNYYRLRMVEDNGKAEYSSVIRLQTAKEEGLKLFPTMASSSVQLSLSVTEKTSAIIRIVDMNGRMVSQQNRNLEGGTTTTTIDVSRLVNGSYILQVQAGQKQLAERFIKQ